MSMGSEVLDWWDDVSGEAGIVFGEGLLSIFSFGVLYVHELRRGSLEEDI
jgi:hypothetical protein